jgi:hypothetical protein
MEYRDHGLDGSLYLSSRSCRGYGENLAAKPDRQFFFSPDFSLAMLPAFATDMRPCL